MSKHLRLLLEAGALQVTERGRERYYALEPAGLTPVQEYVGGLLAPAFSLPLDPRTLDALETEVRRTSRERRSRGGPVNDTTSTEETA